jgi:hypothetical protein
MPVYPGKSIDTVLLGVMRLANETSGFLIDSTISTMFLFKFEKEAGVLPPARFFIYYISL